MDEIETNYVSIFKIDGIPILPPLMTEEKRLEMKQYRELAIEKENGIKMRLSFFKDTESANDADNSKKDHNVLLDELLPVETKETNETTDDHLQKPSSSDQSLNSNRSQQCALDELNSQYLQISSLLHCNDAKDFNKFDDQNRLTKKYQSMINIQNADDDDDDDVDEVVSNKNQIEINNNNNESIHTDTDLSFIESSSKQSVHKDPFNLTELSVSFPNYNTRPGSSSTILDTKRSMTTPRKLVRSNSYTLDSPSPMFVKHMESKGINLSTSWIASPVTDDDTIKFNRQLTITKSPSTAIDLTTAVTVTKAIVTNKEAIPKKPIIVKTIKPKIVIQQKKCTINSSGSNNNNNNNNGQITMVNNKLIKFRKSPYDLRNSKSQIGNYSNKPINRNVSLNGGKKRLTINGVTTASATNLSTKNTSIGKKCLPPPPQQPPLPQKKPIEPKAITNKCINPIDEINNDNKSESISIMSEVDSTSQQSSPVIQTLKQPSETSANIPTNNNNNNCNTNLLNQEQLKEILKRIEESHKNQINLLIERQQEEHEKLQIDFYEQQKRLIKQLKVNNNNNNNSSNSSKSKKNKKSLSKSMSVSSSALSSISTTSSTNSSASASSCSSRTTSDVESIICSTTKSLTTLQTENDHNNNLLENQDDNNNTAFLDEKQNQIKSIESKQSTDTNNDAIVATVTTTPNCYRKLLFNDFEQNEKEILQLNLHAYNYDEMEFKRHKAATIINSYVRGYLIRRLFKTELVQSIIQTIRDTLLFILDLQDESKLIVDGFVESPADLKLKRTLLQQLNSACDKIQNIFNERDIKEKLLIIRKDRELLKRKIMKSKLNQSFNKLFSSSSTATTSSSSSASAPLTATALELHSKKSISNNKLERIELFSVNIKASSSSSTTTVHTNSLSEIPTVSLNGIDRTEKISPTIQITGGGIEPKRSESLYIPAVSTSNRNKIILPKRPATSKIN